MPVSDQTPYVSSNASGGNTYAFPFKVFDDTDLVVNVASSLKVLGTDYAVTINAEPGEGGSVVFLPGHIPAAGSGLVEIERNTPLERTTDYQVAGGFRESVVDRDFDKIVMMVQDRAGQATSVASRTTALEARTTAVESATASETIYRTAADSNLANAVAALGAGLPSNALNDFSTAPRVSDLVIKSSPVDPRAFMTGLDGRPTEAQWLLDGSVDVTDVLQDALDEAGSKTVVPSWYWQSQTHNISQGLVRLSKNKRYTISAPLVVPPGVVLDLNGATIYQLAAGDGIQCAWANNGYGWGNYFTSVENGFIVGPGSGTSTGRGLFLQMVNMGRFRNLKIKGFKFGCTLWEVQYSDFIGVHCHQNVVGWYITAQPAYQNLTSIDNWFASCTGNYNTKYGVWAQCSTASTFDRWDVQKNGIVDVLIGAQLVGYISGYTVVNGGSGYAPSSNIPVTITDANGKMAQAYATTNAGGVVTAVVSVDAGSGYTAPVVAVPGGGVAATVTATVADDTGLGDWDGHSATNRGKNVWDNLKVEHGGGERPVSGYAVIVNDTSSRSNIFNDLVVQRQPQTGGVLQYFRWLRSAGYGTMVMNPADPSTPPSGLTNPAVAGDVSIFRTCDYQALGIQWPVFSGANPGLYVVDDAGTINPRNGKVSYSAFTSDGMLLANGYEADATAIGASTFPVAGFQAKNTTAATAGVANQNSPSIVLGARAFFDDQDNEVLWAFLTKAIAGGSRGDLIIMYKNGAGAWTQSPLSLRGDGSVAITGLPVYADNAAAAGLSVGTLYRTATGQVMIKY